jgi:hypothetical protein
MPGFMPGIHGFFSGRWKYLKKGAAQIRGAPPQSRTILVGGFRAVGDSRAQGVNASFASKRNL